IVRRFACGKLGRASGGRTMRRGRFLTLLAGLGLGLVAGCQTYHPETGLTLPTGHYLRHLPQYFPPTPDFPLPRETAALVAASDGAGGLPVGPPPVGLPPAGLPPVGP